MLGGVNEHVHHHSVSRNWFGVCLPLDADFGTGLPRIPTFDPDGSDSSQEPGPQGCASPPSVGSDNGLSLPRIDRPSHKANATQSCTETPHSSSRIQISSRYALRRSSDWRTVTPLCPHHLWKEEPTRDVNVRGSYVASVASSTRALPLQSNTTSGRSTVANYYRPRRVRPTTT